LQKREGDNRDYSSRFVS